MSDSTWRERARGAARDGLDLHVCNRSRDVGDSAMRHGSRVALMSLPRSNLRHFARRRHIAQDAAAGTFRRDTTRQ